MDSNGKKNGDSGSKTDPNEREEHEANKNQEENERDSSDEEGNYVTLMPDDVSAATTILQLKRGLSKQKSYYKQKIATLRSRYEDEILELRTDLREEKEEAVSELREKLYKTVDEKEQAISELREKLSTAAEDFKSEKFSHALSKQRVKGLEAEVSEKTKEWKEEKKLLKAQHKDDLKSKQDELKDVKKLLKTANSNNTKQAKTLKGQNSELAKARDNLAVLNARDEGFKKKVKELESALKKAEQLVDKQLDAKLANNLAIENLKLKQLTAKAEQAQTEEKMKSEKKKEELFVKKQLMAYSYDLKAKEKMKEHEMKAEAKRESVKGQQHRMETVNDLMMKISRDSKGLFPNAKQTSIHDCIDQLVTKKLEHVLPEQKEKQYVQTTMTQHQEKANANSSLQLPAGWVALVDQGTGETYFFNKTTNNVALSEFELAKIIAREEFEEQRAAFMGPTPGVPIAARTNIRQPFSNREDEVALHSDLEVPVVIENTTTPARRPRSEAPTPRYVRRRASTNSVRRTLGGNILPFVTPKRSNGSSDSGYYTQEPEEDTEEEKAEGGGNLKDDDTVSEGSQ